jgi:dipeptidyl aminopeptidase/acylaminoacyl peptidase
LWDGAAVELIRVLTTAGEGRPTVAEGYRLGPVSLGPGAVWFTEYAGPEDQPSIWRLDLATGARTLVVEDADVPAISPDGTRLAYATGLDGPPQPGIAQVVEILSVGSGATQVIESYGTGGEVQAPATLRHLEWSPDGTRLLFADRYENAIVGVLDPASDRSLSDAVFLTDENIAPTWVDDDTIATGRYCCYAEAVRPLEYVLSDARTGEVIGPAEGVGGTPLDLAARPDGTLLYLKEAERDRPVGILAIPSDRGAIEIEGVRSADW